MANVLFVNGNLEGHFNPTLPVAAELIKRGENVWYFCSKSFENKVVAIGAHFLELGDVIEDFMHYYKPGGDHPFYKLLEYIIRYDNVMIPQLLQVIKDMNFDYIIYDSILGGGFFLKEILNIPVICSNTTFVMDKLPLPQRMLEPGFHPQLDEFYHLFSSECKKWNKEIPDVYDFFINKGDINIVYTSREFNGGEYFDESFHFVGPSIKSRNENRNFPFELLKDKKTVYISLGTINNNYEEFYQLCIKALQGLEAKIIISVGTKCDITLFKEVPENFVIVEYAPQLEILKSADLFITHGGFNSVSEALIYGVPMIVVPMVNDQYMTAKRVAEVGAGIVMKMEEITNEKLLTNVNLLLEDSKYREASAETGKTFHLEKGYGYEKAADVILEYMERQKNGSSK